MFLEFISITLRIRSEYAISSKVLLKDSIKKVGRLSINPTVSVIINSILLG